MAFKNSPAGRSAIVAAFAFLLSITTATSIYAATGASVDESLATQTVYVDGSLAGSGNPGNGSAANPFVDITRAANYASSLRNAIGTGVKISIAPGTYRESVYLSDTQHASNPIIFEAQQPGTVRIKGSDVFDQWSFNSSTGAFTTDWGPNWTTANDPTPAGVQFDAIGRRRELVTYDGNRLQQVLDKSELAPGRFFVDENIADRKLWVVPPTGSNIQNATVEAAVRENTFNVLRSSNVVVRGLQFEHGASPVNTSSATFNNNTHLLLDQLTAANNGQIGLGGGNNQFVTGTNLTFEDNGLVGMGMTRSTNTVWDGMVARENNWRGYSAGLTGWFAAGIKHLLMEDADYRNITTEDNLTHGLWFDTHNIDITVDNLTSRNNLERGIYIEKNDGPFSLANSLIHDNGDHGIYIAISENVTVTGNTVYDNAEGQLAFAGRDIKSDDTITGGTIDFTFEGSDVRNNVFASTDPTGEADLIRFLLSLTGGEGGGEERRLELFNSLVNSAVDTNEYWHVIDGRHFAGQMGGDQTWDGYRSQFGLDLNSTYTIGAFVIPEPATAALLGLTLFGCLRRRG
jgi:parallel beta-helix repeat protein